MQANILTFNVQGAFSLAFFADELNFRPDFHILTNSKIKEVDILIFFDSRGVSNSFDYSIVDRIIKAIDDKQTYLLISRPLEITTWMTLYNFLKLNLLMPKKIITNMGFVDFTPKKMSVIEKSLIQYDYYFSQDSAKIEFLEYYTSSDGITLDLFMQDYPPHFKECLESEFKDVLFLIVNTPELVSEFEFPRARPKSFLQNVLKGNRFNEELVLQKKIFDFNNFTIEETYDGVHYTSKGNEAIFSVIEPYL